MFHLSNLQCENTEQYLVLILMSVIFSDVLDTPAHEPDTKAWAQEMKANVLGIKEELPYSSEDKLDVSEQMKLKMESEESIKGKTIVKIFMYVCINIL